MAQIGYGYGSEFQLLRFLGHHRHLLEQMISKAICQNGVFDWLDFGFESPMKSISGDSENKGLSFLKEIISEDLFHKINNEYRGYKINNINNWQNWDAVFTLNGILYLVEAKAHVDELSDPKKHGGESAKEILRFFKDQLPQMDVTEEWLKDYYQLANRLSMSAMLNKYLPTKALYIFFENGFSRRTIKNKKIIEISNLSSTKEEFEKAFNDELLSLGLNNLDLSGILSPLVFIDASPLVKNDK